MIFDASVEPGNGNNYAAVTGELMLLDHVLIVSRTYLPLNMLGLRIGGSPLYDRNQTNEEIINWLRAQIADIKAQLQGGNRPRDFLGLRTWSKSSELRKQRLNNLGQIFISFRSNDAKDVNELKLRIESGDYHNGLRKNVLYFPPGVLSSELMAEQRRWQIVSIIREYLSAADEVWIYENKNYYYNSWWTLAELLTLSYLRSSRPQVKLYDPHKQVVRDAPADYLHKLTDGQLDRAARWFANCAPDTMGPESVAVWRMLGKIPIINQFSMVRDRVWGEEFWDFPILDCYQCRTIGEEANRYSVEDLLYTRGANYTRFSPEEIQHSLQSGEITCPNCKTIHKVKQGKPHYLWIPTGNAEVITQMMARTWEAISNFLVKMPTYLVN